MVEHILDVNGVIGSSPIPPTMKTEKQPDKKSAAEIEGNIERNRLEKSLEEIVVELEDTKNENLLRFKKLIDQGVAKFDFEKDEKGNVKSVVIKRTLTGEILFHANNKSCIGQTDIKRVLGLMHSGQLD